MKNVLLFLCTLLLVACSSNDNYREKATSSISSKKSAPSKGEDAAYDTNFEQAENSPLSKNKTTSQHLPSPIEESKKIIKTGNLTIKVDNYKEARAELGDIVNSYGAYFSSEMESNQNYQLANNLSIMVQPEHFEDVIKGIEGIAAKIDSKTTTAADVSKQFVDINARLQSKRDVVARYRSIMKKANTIPEILDMEERIRVIVEEVEAMEGQLRYLTKQVGLSTINLRMYEVIERPIAKAQPNGFLTKALAAVGNGWNNILDIVLSLLSIWPSLFFLMIVGFFAIKYVRRFR